MSLIDKNLAELLSRPELESEVGRMAVGGIVLNLLQNKSLGQMDQFSLVNHETVWFLRTAH